MLKYELKGRKSNSKIIEVYPSQLEKYLQTNIQIFSLRLMLGFYRNLWTRPCLGWRLSLHPCLFGGTDHNLLLRCHECRFGYRSRGWDTSWTNGESGLTTRDATKWMRTLRCVRLDGWKRKITKNKELSNLRGVDPQNKGNRGSRESSG